MRHRALSIAGLALVLTLAFTGSASALTLGITTPPSGFALLACDGTVYEQYTSDPTTPYTVPVGGGQITQWQTSTAADPANAAGTSVTFVVLSPPGSGDSVVAADTETLPNPLPADGVASYALATPLTVSAGDTLALYSSSLLHSCFFAGGTTPTGDTLQALSDASPPPTAGQDLTVTAPQSPSGYALNLAATLTQPASTPPTQSEDAAVTTSIGATGTTAGQSALLSSTVTDNGPGGGPITFTDDVPAGLSIVAAAASQGTCATAGQVVSCTISGLGSGQSAPVSVVITAKAAGAYTNSVSVAVGAGDTDPDPANNTASATLHVATAMTAGGTPPVERCMVPSLIHTPWREARSVLKALGCRVRITHRRSGKVRRGRAIRTNPKHGTYAYRKVITLVVSSGPRRPTP